MPVAEVQALFKPKAPLPAPKGIAPNQPSPYAEAVPRLWKQFAIISVVVFFLQIVFAFRSHEVASDKISVSPGGEQSLTTQPFTIKGNQGSTLVRAETDLKNTWAALTYTLVDPASGQTWSEGQEIGYYEGYDEGESWNEGSKNGEVVFYGVPPGQYVLNVSAELPKDAMAPLSGKIIVEHGHASWLNWLVLQLALMILPFYGWWRQRSFENQRWADSDHPRGGGDDDDD